MLGATDDGAESADS